MADETPVVETTTTQTSKATGEAATNPPPPPAPTPEADDWIRKVMAVAIMVQFTIYICVVTYLVLYQSKELSNTANSLIMIILTAEIGYMGQTFSYYMGSSSGSTQKSALLAEKKP